MQTTRKVVPIRPTQDHYNGNTTFWLAQFLSNSRSLDRLYEMRDNAAKAEFSATVRALSDGIYALRTHTEIDVRRVRDLGQLPLAWAGTRALEGGAV